MPGKARPGRAKSKSGAKKRISQTGTGAYTHEKASHNHLLMQKSPQQKRLARRKMLMSPSYSKMVKRMLPGT